MFFLSTSPACRKCGTAISTEDLSSEMPSQDVLLATHFDSRLPDAKVRADLQLWDAELAQLNALATQIEVRRDCVKESQARRRAFLAPIRRLPAELLVEIFEECFLSPSRAGKAPHREWLLVLSHVCKRWRHVLLNTPQLWAKIPNVRSALLLEHVWIPRSAQLLLDVDLQDDPFAEYSKEANLESRGLAILQALLPVHHRWRTFRISLDGFYADFLGEQDLCLPNLEVLDIQGVEYQDGLHRPFSDAPRLRCATLSNFPPELDLFWLPLAGLQELSLADYVSFQCFALILHRCPVLQDCTAEIMVDEENSWEVVRHDKLQKLVFQSFSVEFGGLGGLAQTFSALTLPALENFGLCNNAFEHGVWAQSEFLAFISRSNGAALRRLSPDGVPIQDNELVDCLLAMPSLESLALRDVIVATGKVLFARLVLPDHSVVPEASARPYLQPLVPCLVDFDMHLRCNEDPVDQTALIAVINSRLWSLAADAPSVNGWKCSRLRSFMLWLKKDCPEMREVWSQMPTWKEKGLHAQYIGPSLMHL